VGVSNNLPNNPFRQSGIVGVHPLSILLEPLELQAAGGLGELLALLEGAGYDVDKTVLNEPYCCRTLTVHVLDPVVSRNVEMQPFGKYQDGNLYFQEEGNKQGKLEQQSR